jgi:hypothetical protein
MRVDGGSTGTTKRPVFLDSLSLIFYEAAL